MAKNTVRYHISKNGVPAACQAKKRMCPLGGDEKHFATKEEAQVEADRILEKKYPMNRKKEKMGENFSKRKKSNSKVDFKKDEKEIRRQRVDMQRAAKYKDREVPYRLKIKSIEVFEGELKRNVESFHFNETRHNRTEQLENLFGKSTPVATFIIDDGRLNKQIHEIHDTGKIKIYDVDTHRPITEFQPQPERLKDIFSTANMEAPGDLIQVARVNRRTLDRANPTSA